jgi:hypothetical protein
MYYRIWYVENNTLNQGTWWPYIEANTEDLDMHILGFLENFPGEFYDIEYKKC